MKNILTLFVLISITVISCTKEKTPSPIQILFPSFENSNLKMEVVSSSFPDENDGDIHFFNGETGIISTSSGNIYKTVDGGMNWNKKYSDPSGHYLQQILFEGNAVGYVVGYSHSNDWTGVILKTIDGGETWQNIFELPGAEFETIAANTNGDLFVSNHGELVESHDHGLTWTENLIPSIRNIIKITFSHGLGFCVGQDSSSKGIILRSDDNGSSWHEAGTFNSIYYIDDIAFADGTGYCIADLHLIYKTTDDGDSWTQVYDAVSRTYKLDPLSSSNCLIWGAGPYTGGDFGTYYGAVRQSKDSGATWAENIFNDISGIQHTSFYSPTHGYAIAGSTLIKVTIK